MNLPVVRQLAEAPGFIRRFSVVDGVDTYLVAFWRTLADAERFTRTPEHRHAVQALYRDHILYSHFVGLWQAHSVHARLLFCPACAHPNPVPATTCTECGEPLPDAFVQSPVPHGSR